MQALRRLFAICLIVLFAGLGSGCVAAAAAGAGAGAAYATGDTEATFPVKPDAVAQAVRQVYKNLDISLVDKLDYGEQFVLEGQTSSSQSVTVRIRPRGEATRVWVRVGLIGDNDLSALILKRINQRL